MTAKKQFKFLDWFAPVFTDDKTYWVISGGRASGKSTQAAAYFLMKLMGKEYFRGVVSRYTQKSISSSIYRDILDLIADWNLTPYLTIKGDEIKLTGSRNMITTHSMRLQEGTVTSKGKGLSKVTHLLIDEATELPSEEEYIKLIDSFRQKGSERKIFLLFNPVSKSHWIYRRFFLPDGQPNPRWSPTHGYLHTTYRDNIDNLSSDKIKEWEDSKVHDPDYYVHHILGEWTDIGAGQVFKDWQFDWEPQADCEILYGLDFGFSSDPTAMVKVHKRGKRLWVEQILYHHGLTNQDISDCMSSAGVDKSAVIIADAAEPKSIEELRRLGWRNIRAAAKGQDSIRAGIQKIRGYEVKANPQSADLIEEFYQYAYRTGTDQPIDSYNHLMDAFRYALSHDQGETSRYAVMGKPKRVSEWDTF
jgi:phage terminase large subunit